MWRRRKTELEQLKKLPGAAKAFLRSVDTNLYQTSLGEMEDAVELTLEQDPHTSGDGFESYILSARKERNHSCRLPMPVIALQIMEELLSDLTVFTAVQETSVPRPVVEELANYQVSPHMFSTTYARFCNSHPTSKERVFFNGCDSLVTVTSGANRALLEPLYMTPGYDYTISALMCGVAETTVPDVISDYEDAKRIGPEKCHIWMKYYCSQLLIGLLWSKAAEQQLISKIQSFCQKHGMQLCVEWPYNE